MVSMCVLCCFLYIEHRYWMFYVCVGSAQLDFWARQVKLPFFFVSMWVLGSIAIVKHIYRKK
jgi:hypothetical protein